MYILIAFFSKLNFDETNNNGEFIKVLKRCIIHVVEKCALRWLDIWKTHDSFLRGHLQEAANLLYRTLYCQLLEANAT